MGGWRCGVVRIGVILIDDDQKEECLAFVGRSPLLVAIIAQAKFSFIGHLFWCEMANLRTIGRGWSGCGRGWWVVDGWRGVGEVWRW